MLQLTPQSVIWVATATVDFRKGTDGLIAICRQQLGLDPFSGALFLFYNKSRTSCKILCFDGQGFWLCLKRLSTGKFKLSHPKEIAKQYYQVCHRSMYILINNGDLASAKLAADWRKPG